MYRHSNNNQLFAITANHNGSSAPSRGSAIYITTTTTTPKLVDDPNTGKMILIFNNNSTGECRALTMSGSSLTDNAGYQFSSNSGSYYNGVYDTVNSKLIITWSESNTVKARTATTSGNSFTFSSSTVTLGTIVGGNYAALTFNTETEKATWVGKHSTDNYLYYADVDASGSNPTFGTAAIVDNSNSNNNWTSGAFDPDTKQDFFCWQATNDRGSAAVRNAGSTTLTTENFIGFSSAAYTNGQTATINVTGNTSTQSSLTPGQKYYVQKNGSIGLTAADPSVEAGTALTSTKLLIKA